MPDKPPLDENSVAVQKHLDIMQCVINRMANTSRALKTWCITIVAAIFVVVAKTDLPGSAVLIALVPTIMFFGMDAYYLGMEKGFRDSYSILWIKFHNEKLSVNGDLIRSKSRAEFVPVLDFNRFRQSQWLRPFPLS